MVQAAGYRANLLATGNFLFGGTAGQVVGFADGVIALLEPVSRTPGALFRYSAAILSAIAGAFIVHLALSRLVTIPARRGGYGGGRQADREISDAEPAG
jgi:NCS1 family nucleobase:cation symporter-1